MASPCVGWRTLLLPLAWESEGDKGVDVDIAGDDVDPDCVATAVAVVLKRRGIRVRNLWITDSIEDMLSGLILSQTSVVVCTSLRMIRTGRFRGQPR